MDLSKCLIILLYSITALSVVCSPLAYLGILLALILVIKQDLQGRLFSMLVRSKGMLLIALSIAVSTVASRELLFSAAADVLFIFLVAFCYTLIYVFSNTKKNYLYQILSWTCTFVCLYGLYQFFTGDIHGIKSWVDQKSFGSLTRIYSTLQNPNVFAGYIVINLCFFISKYLHNEKQGDKLLAPNIILLSVCLILTYSRGGFLSLLAAMLVMLAFKREKRLVLYIAVMIAMFYLYNSLGKLNRADIDIIYKDSSNTYRIEIWKAAIQVFLKNPITGLGIGTTWYHLSTYSNKLFKYVIHAHNIYLQIAAELGLLGLSAFIYFTVSELIHSLKLWFHSKGSSQRYAFLGFICSTTAILAHGMFDAVIFIPSLAIVYMNYFALYKLAAASIAMEKPLKLSSYMQNIHKKQAVQI